MTMDSARQLTHLSDADLLRHLDGEGGDAERDRHDAHLRDCRACAERARRLRGQSDAVRSWLVRTDHPQAPAALPTRGRRAATAAPWLRAAAIVLLLAAPLAALPPVRAWVAERVGLAGETDAAPESSAATPATVQEAVIRFSPAPGVFTVRVDGPTPTGTLEVGRAAGTEAVLRGAPAAAAAPIVADEILRLPAGGPAGSRAYRLRVPASVEAVRIVLPGRTLLLSAAAIDSGTTVPLERPAPAR